MFRVILLGAVTVGARRLLAGSETLVDAATARAWIEAGAARLSADADLPRLVAALGVARPATMTR